MTQQTIHLTRGLPAAGKTTWAKDWVLEDPTHRGRANRDDLRAMLFVKPTFGWEQEQLVTTVQQATVRALLAAGCDVVVDDTNLRPKYVRGWLRFAAAHRAVVEVHQFYGDVDEHIARDAARPNPVGADVIRRMATKYMPRGQFLPIDTNEATADQPPLERYMGDPTLPPAVIVDIDGTVAHKHPDRDIYDLTKVADDLPNTPVIEAVQAAKRDGMTIVYCSGREDTARGATAMWITNNVEVPGELFMRAAGDSRRDSIVKRELFDAHIRGRYDVRYVLDDRQQVVDMWRALGLTCLQVAPGDF